jgi:hypothetical protein
MTDSQWSLIIGAVIVIITRVVDVFLPEGYIARLTDRYLKRKPDDDDDQVEEE